MESEIMWIRSLMVLHNTTYSYSIKVRHFKFWFCLCTHYSAWQTLAIALRPSFFWCYSSWFKVTLHVWPIPPHPDSLIYYALPVDRFYVWYVWKAIYGIILGVKVKEIFKEGNIQRRKLSNWRLFDFLFLLLYSYYKFRVSLFNQSCT